MFSYRFVSVVASFGGFAAFGALLSACEGGPTDRIEASYDPFTSRLVQIGADQNRDGRLDQWTFTDGNRVLHGEADADGDGRIDRWEYFDAASTLVSIGTASRNDGIEDTWVYTAPTTDGLARIARSRQRDRQIDRTEFYRGDVLERAEEDTNADGRPDRWDRWEGAVMREAAFDMTFRAGRPNRRIVYDGSGRFVAVEADEDGDGSFVRMPAPPPVSRRVER